MNSVFPKTITAYFDNLVVGPPFYNKTGKLENIVAYPLFPTLLSENPTKIISNIQLGCVCSLSDHSTIHLQLSFSKVQKGRGFWRMRNKLLTDLNFINGCNYVIKIPWCSTLDNLERQNDLRAY